jgi:cytochrome c
MRETCLSAAAAALVASGVVFAAETPNLGRPATPADIAAYDISADPDGAGSPPGSGTPAQGAKIYAEKCAACHGEKGVGGQADRLAGGKGTISYGTDAGKRPVKSIGSYWPYATSLFAYIRRAMPFQQTKSLTPDEIYAATAYLLALNGIIGENDAMNADTLPKVRMPNRDGFFPFKPPVPVR